MSNTIAALPLASNEDQKTLTSKEAAEYLGVSYVTFQQYMRYRFKGKLVPAGRNKRGYFFTKEMLDSIQALRVRRCETTYRDSTGELFYRTRGAATYLGITRCYLYLLLHHRKIVPDKKIGREWLYRKATLDLFLEQQRAAREQRCSGIYMNEQGERLYTIRQAADQLGISPSHFYHTARFRAHGEVVFEAKAGSAFVFTQAEIDRVKARLSQPKVHKDKKTGARMYTIQHASEYLGMHKAAFSLHYHKGHVRPDGHLCSRRPLFCQETLNRFVAEHPRATVRRRGEIQAQLDLE